MAEVLEMLTQVAACIREEVAEHCTAAHLLADLARKPPPRQIW